MDEEAYPDDLYDMYGGGDSRGSRPQQNRSRNQQRYMEDEDEDGSDYDGGSIDEGDFEMMNPRRGRGSVSGSSRGQSRRPEVRKVRVKVHADDVRYIMVGTAIEFPDMVDRVRDKFGLRRRFKIKIRDEDSPADMITMGDQDDLEMAMMTVKSQARKQRLEVGKLEVRLRDDPPCCSRMMLTMLCRSGFKKFRPNPHFITYISIYNQQYTRRRNDGSVRTLILNTYILLLCSFVLVRKTLFGPILCIISGTAC